MDDAQPRHAEGGGSSDAPSLRSVTLLAEAGETAEQALEDWSRGLDWVHWLFSSIRQRTEGLYFHATDLPQPSLYPRHPLTQQALSARWEDFTQTQLRGALGHTLLQAWQAVQAQDLTRLQALDIHLQAHLTPQAQKASHEAGTRLLQGTRGARYQALLGRYRSLHENGETPGHFLIVWAAVAQFFQLSLANVIAEYIRLEWDLASRQLPTPTTPLSLENIASLTSHLMQSHAKDLHLLSQKDADPTPEERQEAQQ